MIVFAIVLAAATTTTKTNAAKLDANWKDAFDFADENGDGYISISHVKNVFMSHYAKNRDQHHEENDVEVLHHGNEVWEQQAEAFVEYIAHKGTPGVEKISWDEFDILMFSYLHHLADGGNRGEL